MRRVRLLTVAILVVLAGCSGAVQDGPTTTATTTSPTATTPTATTNAQTTTTQTPPTTPPPANPWEQEVVTVAVQNHAGSDRDVTPLVNQTIQYWNEHASTYGDYEVTFVATSNTREADIVVEYVIEIEQCGYHATDATVGCASLLEKWDTAAEQETVQVVAGFSDNSTLQILKHEFGHLLGIEHGEEPMPTMKALSQHTYLSQPNATGRALPWKNNTLTVYLSTENRTYTETVTEQVEHALAYYERGADGHVPENLSFVMTDNESAADITISFPTAVTCGDDRSTAGSCGWLWGYDTDTDRSLEYYSRVEIRVAHQTDAEAVGWHVGYWLTTAFGLESKDELPPPFVDADYSERRSEWWEE